jgi:hypothetical protein
LFTSDKIVASQNDPQTNINDCKSEQQKMRVTLSEVEKLYECLFDKITGLYLELSSPKQKTEYESSSVKDYQMFS